MDPLRISVTTLESYRLYRSYDWKSEEALLADIRGEFVKTPEMRAGIAFHQILETPDACRQEKGYAHDGHAFASDVVDPCLALFDRAGVFEVKLPKVYDVSGRPVTVVAKADQLHGLDIVENKTKWSQFDIDSYAESCQWRFYVDIFEARRVHYNVFRLSLRKEGYSLDGIERFTLYPYPNLARDCRALLADFVDYVELRKLQPYLQPRAA